MQKQRILFVDLGSHYGGVETYLKGLCGILSPYVQGYALVSMPKLAAELRGREFTVMCLPILGSSWLKGVRMVMACFLLPYMLLRYRIRTVQINGFFESLFLVPLHVAGVKTIFTMHNPFETDRYSWFRHPERFFPRLLSKHCLCLANQVICVSEAVGVLARSVVPAERVKVIANWVDSPATFRSVFSTGKRSQLLFVGRVEEYKGVQFILQAMQQMPDVSLLVVGEGSYRPQLEAAAEGMAVRFAGFQADPSRFYKDSTVFINPSMGPEGLPLVSLEAMAHGLPCILSNLPVHLEVTGGGEAAALFERGDSSSLRQQIERLLNDEDERRRYGLNARQLIEQRYNMHGAAQQYVQAFGLS